MPITPCCLRSDCRRICLFEDRQAFLSTQENYHNCYNATVRIKARSSFEAANKIKKNSRLSDYHRFYLKSPSELLLERGAEVSYCDPHVPSLPKMRHYNLPEMTTSPPTPEYYASLDCVLISTDHSLFNWDEIVEHATLVVDTRNATKNVTNGRKKIFKA